MNEENKAGNIKVSINQDVDIDIDISETLMEIIEKGVDSLPEALEMMGKQAEMAEKAIEEQAKK